MSEGHVPTIYVYRYNMCTHQGKGLQLSFHLHE